MAAKKKIGIKRELPPVGTVLNGKFKGTPHTAKVIEHKQIPYGRAVKYNNKIYLSLTAAAKAITNQSVNGWRFWKF